MPLMLLRTISGNDIVSCSSGNDIVSCSFPKALGTTELRRCSLKVLFVISLVARLVRRG